jgi:hypothetical protein
MTEEQTNRRPGAILYEGFELLDLYGPLEMFGCLGPEMEIVTVADVTEYQWHTDADRDPFVKFLNQADLQRLFVTAGKANG